MVIVDVCDEKIPEGGPRLDKASEKRIGGVACIALSAAGNDVSHDRLDGRVCANSEDGLHDLWGACGGDEAEARGDACGNDRKVGRGRESFVVCNVKKEGVDEVDGVCGEVAFGERGDVRDEDKGGGLCRGDGGGEMEDTRVVVSGGSETVDNEDGAGVGGRGEGEGGYDVGFEGRGEREGASGDGWGWGDGEVEA